MILSSKFIYGNWSRPVCINIVKIISFDDTIEWNKFSIPAFKVTRLLEIGKKIFIAYLSGNRKENIHSLPVWKYKENLHNLPVWALYLGLWCNFAALQARTPSPPYPRTPAPAPSP